MQHYDLTGQLLSELTELKTPKDPLKDKAA